MNNISQLRFYITVISLISHVMISAEIAGGEGSNSIDPNLNSLTGNVTIVDNGTGNSSRSNRNESELQTRVEALENRLRAVEALLASVSNDAQFYHPTSEVQFVDMEVVHWDEAVKNNLRNVAIPFQAGYLTGAISNWEFSLASENDAVTVNLLLIEERYGRKAMFAGFTAYVLNTEGNVYSQANALPVNFLDGSGRNLHLPNVVSLNEIRNSSNGLLSDDDVFKMRFRLELLAMGHKLYTDNPVLPQSPSKDIQTVIFDVTNLFEKLEEKKQNRSNSTNPMGSEAEALAYTKFSLAHDAWSLKTNWSAEIFDGEKPDSPTFHVILEQCKWAKLYASFYLEVWDSQNKRLLHKQGTPVNDFMKDRITIDPLFVVSHLKEDYHDGEELPPMLQFKLQFVVYGRNARYYTDVV